ncbi:MAG TPA: Crp/Fnr family transcriptional regulator [Blastocatellia bacterium]|nr:Crp/Fnr family transcriptional regulator [Blastocatellia bacterium]
MIQLTTQADLFIQQLRDALRRETRDSRAIKVAKHENVYTCGEQGDTVYFIESGQVKLVMVSPEGRECIFAVHGDGEVFGELSLSGLGERIETAAAMEATNLKVMSSSRFLALLSSNALLEGFVRYLAVRIAEQQQVIAHLVTGDSEQRLGKTLLQLARTLGKRDPDSLRIDHKITHQELSEMVGTTRSRVSVFMQRFRNLGLIETGDEHFLIIKEKKLTAYLAQIA